MTFVKICQVFHGNDRICAEFAEMAEKDRDSGADPAAANNGIGMIFDFDHRKPVRCRGRRADRIRMGSIINFGL